MNRPLNMLVVVLAAATLTAGLPAYAHAESSLIDVDFPGGTITEYVNVIRQAVGQTNIVISPEAADIMVPPVRLKSVPLVAALEVLQGDYQPSEHTEYRVRLQQIGPWGEDDEEVPICRVSAEVHRRGRPQTTTVRVWCIADMAGIVSPEDLLAAIETAIGLTDTLEHGEALIRFHEPTSLIIASGHPVQLDSVDQVVDRLRDDIRRRREDANADKGKQLEEVMQRTLALEAELEHRTRMMEELRIRVETENAERQRVEQETANSRELVRRYAAEIDALRMQLNEANKK